MRPTQIPAFLEEQRSQAAEEFQTKFLEFEDSWERKLWHPLTESLIAYFGLPASATQRLPMFKEFVLSFADKINQLKLVELGLMASTQCSDDQERLSFLSSLADTVNKDSTQDAYVYALADVAAVKLRLHDAEGSRKDLDQCQDTLDKFDSVETVVYAEFYRVNAHYYQTLADFSSYYRTALLYLSCVSLDEIPADARLSRAYDLSIAALASDSIYNFGELLLHPILASLQQSRAHAWLVDLLYAFNNGDTTAYSILVTNMHKEPLLEQNKTLLHQKISLAALTDSVFKRPPHDRTMSFATIQHATNVQPSDVEHLVMKALSLGLLRGTIDQVGQLVNITWVQPKVLDLKQVDGMRQRLQDWDGGLNRLGHWIEKTGGDVWAA